MDNPWEYENIVKELGIDPDADLRAAKVLDALIPRHDPNSDLLRLERILNGRIVVVYGAGPSLVNDLHALKKESLHRQGRFVHIAADGAAKALLREGIVPDVHVTDLDGFPDSIREANRRGSVTVVHAHSDNIALLKKIVPELKSVIGTTQTKPFGSLHNFGGFTDGDRCAFLAEGFCPGLIVLAGMDFGKEIGKYAGTYDKNLKEKKLAIGKRLIEGLARRSRSVILNMTSGGEDIRGVPRVTVGQLALF